MSIKLFLKSPSQPKLPARTVVESMSDNDISKWGMDRVRALHTVRGRRDAPLRKTSNLLNYVPRDLKPSETREGFFGFYFGRHRADSRMNNLMFYIGLALSFMRPNMKLADLKSPGFRRRIRGSLNEYRTFLKKNLEPASQIQVKKDNTTQQFIVRAPIFATNIGIATVFSSMFFVPEEGAQEPLKSLNFLSEVDENYVPDENDFVFNRAVPASALHINQFITNSLKKGLDDAQAKFILRRNGSGETFGFLELTITKEQSEYLTTLPFVQIRPHDIYGPVRAWIGGINVNRQPPTFTVPLSKIRSTTSGGEPRTNEDKILIDEDGEFWSIPDEVDNIDKYDTDYAAHLQNPSGFYGTVDDDLNQKGNVPASMPVYVDWLNLKFAYSVGSGNVVVKALDRCVPANVTHYNRLFNKSIENNPYLMNMLSFAVILGKKYGTYNPGQATVVTILSAYREFLARNEEHTGIKDVRDLTLKVLYEHTSIDKDPSSMSDLFPSQTVDDLLKSFGPTLNALQENLPVANKEYSVETICRLQAFLTILSKYGPKYEELYKMDRKAREAYTDQTPDPNYKLDDIPYIAKDRALLPHQVKVSNMSRKSPDFMVIAADAGGGKTMMGIVDFLRELKNNPNIRGLVMCPSHLVKDYVVETVYATNGLLNAIAVNTYTIKRMGLNLLREMIEKSPVNTLVITDYNAIRLQATRAGYGNSTQQVFPVIEFLRQFRFDWVWADESHFLKSQSGRQSAVHRLFAEIPKKRLASGTFVADTPRDVIRQIGLMDPTLFGDDKQFVSDYGTGVENGKQTYDEPSIKAAIRKNVVWAEARRREWASMLPFPVHQFGIAHLTEKQMAVYKQIVGEVTVDIQRLAVKNPALRKLLKALSMGVDSSDLESENNEEDLEDEKIDQTNSSEKEDEEDDLTEMDLDKMLSPYLARIEQFLTAPTADKIGNIELTSEEDRRSPKVNKLISILDEHFAAVAAGTIKGKVLIFTQYKASAEAVYNSLPPKYKEMCIHYTAGRKAECGVQFKNDDRKQIMVGVETSMNTGLNLQFCVRLIRMENCWTPGNFEQGSSRINRPNVKQGEFRKYIYYNWIICDNSIDVTKCSYLISKILSKARFDEDDERYRKLKAKPFKMTLDNIIDPELNTVAELKTEYIDQYTEYLNIQQAEYTEYRKAYEKAMRAAMGDKAYEAYVAKNGALVKTDIVRARDLPNSKLLARIPYVPGTELYGAKHLGLVRYDELMQEESTDINEEDDDAEESETIEQREKNAADMAKLKGMYAHTDLGDGEIVAVNKSTVRIKLSSGHRISTNKLSTFIITKPLSNAQDARDALAKMEGQLPLDKPPTVPSAILTVNKDRKLSNEQKRELEVLKQQDDGKVPVVMRLGTLNDFLVMEIVNVEDDAAVRAAQGQGFRFAPPHFVTKILHSFRFNLLINLWARSGTDKDKSKPKGPKLTIDPRCSEALWRVSKHVGERGKMAGVMFNVARATEIRIFMKIQQQPNPNKNFIAPYPMFEDGSLFICLPAGPGHPGTKTAMDVIKNSGSGHVAWKKVEGNERLQLIAPSKDLAWRKIEQMEREGFNITNKAELEKQFKAMKQVREANRPMPEIEN